jgi:hypothetical protein
MEASMTFIPVTRGSSGESFATGDKIRIYRNGVNRRTLRLVIDRAVIETLGWVPNHDRVQLLVGTGVDRGKIQMAKTRNATGYTVTPDGHYRAMRRAIICFTIPTVIGGEDGDALINELQLPGECEVISFKPTLLFKLPMRGMAQIADIPPSPVTTFTPRTRGQKG